MPRVFEFKQYKCPRCGKMYEDSEQGHFPGKPCKQCTQLMMGVNSITKKLMEGVSCIEEEDKVVAQQIKDILIEEDMEVGLNKGNEDVLNSLIARLGADEEKRRRLIEEIRKLQKKKL